MEEQRKRFKALYHQHHDALGGYCRVQAYGCMDPEDLVGETVLKAFESFHKLKDEKAFLGYLMAIARNIVNTKLRRKKFSAPYSEHFSETIKDESVDAEMKYDIEVLYECLNKLQPETKEAIVLFDISGYSIKEVAEIQQVGESAVKQRLRRGRIKLGEILKQGDMQFESTAKPSQILRTLFF